MQCQNVETSGETRAKVPAFCHPEGSEGSLESRCAFEKCEIPQSEQRGRCLRDSGDVAFSFLDSCFQISLILTVARGVPGWSRRILPRFADEFAPQFPDRSALHKARRCR